MIKLIAGLWTGLSALIAAFFAFYGRKASVVTLGLATFLALVVVFVSCINALVGYVSGLIDVAFGGLPSVLAVGIGMFIPSDFGLILSAIVSGKICRAAFDLAKVKVNWWVTGS